MDQTRERFKTALWADKPINIVLGGAGGISSWTALFLARSSEKYSIRIVDPDTVEEVNFGGQFFNTGYVNNLKAEALYRSIREVVPNVPSISTSKRRIQDIPVWMYDNVDYMIAGFDNMEARKYMFNLWKGNPNRKLFIEGRLLAEFYEIYIVVPGREEEYEKTLFEQEEANESDAPCTFRATSHFGAMIGARINHALNSFLANLSQGSLIYSLPFRFAEYGPQWRVESNSIEGEDLDGLFEGLRAESMETEEVEVVTDSSEEIVDVDSLFENASEEEDERTPPPEEVFETVPVPSDLVPNEESRERGGISTDNFPW